MIDYRTSVLNNGLQIVLHKDISTPLVSVNVLYNVGSRDEQADKTGFAHLFEHLMFSGSENIPNYDYYVEQAGGESNAFTNNDITNYYLTVPKQFLETALWLESDRMKQLDFSQKSLDVQKNVVSEEFKQRYLNQPYGDIWLALRPLAYKQHPYQWCTIGKDLSHIENASLDDVKAFFRKFYHPGNAVLTIAGNIDIDDALHLIEKWFSPIPEGEAYIRNLPQEPLQTEARYLTLERNVPANAIYKAFPICGRLDRGYYIFDLISDILSSGKSSRLYNELVKKEKLFSEVNAFITGETDPGLFVICGKLQTGVSLETAGKALWLELEKMQTTLVDKIELQKVITKMETSFVFSQYKALDKAMNLAYYHWLGNIDLINTEPQKYKDISPDDIRQTAIETFKPEKCSTLFYKSISQN